MPFLDSPEGRSDGGYAVADFRKVRPDLGSMEDLAVLTEDCHRKDMNVCMDFVMNHTSEDHEWAKRARQGDGEYMSRYFFYDNYDIPRKYEETVPQVFPTTAPGNFTYLPEMNHYVLTTFYPYQWDLNYKNPRVFNEMMYNFLYLANQGIDIIRIDAVPYIWKELGTSCRNLPKVHAIVDAHNQGFDENMYLDAGTRTKVEETGGANFLFVTKDGKVVTPKSNSILPSITRRSLMYVAKEYLGLEAEEREVYFDEVKDFAECGLCGTAAVISPVGKIIDHGKEICFPSGMEAMGPVTQKLYDTLTGIQMGRLEAPKGWLKVIE